MATQTQLRTIMPLRRQVLTLHILNQALCHTAFRNKVTARMEARMGQVQYPLL